MRAIPEMKGTQRRIMGKETPFIPASKGVVVMVMAMPGFHLACEVTHQPPSSSVNFIRIAN